jgi:hypothetical protein
MAHKADIDRLDFPPGLIERGSVSVRWPDAGEDGTARIEKRED